jgi:acyl transferase domain-containing protein/acyl carrier protein
MTGTLETGCDIAIVGMACRFPGARNIDEFWTHLAQGTELITALSDDELLAAGVDPRLLADPSYVKADGMLEGIDLFDAAFFGYTPKEAELMDPQVRLFLEVAWEALEMAGYRWDANAQRVAVYAGASMNSYLLNNLYPDSRLIDSVGAFQTTILNNRDYLPLHVSYRLNLNGPSVNVQTACSTSLVAVHLACQSLLGRESDLALAGGSSIRVPQGSGYQYEEGGILSPDGYCRAFDERAAGTVASSGAGAVVLKRLDDAVADRDFIYAVIKGTAVNNDGALKAGFTAPAVEGQAAVIEEAIAMAMIPPETITYVETHGTATPLGDPIEIAALTQAFRRYTNASRFCRIGSVKTNLGHLDAAAGVAGLIKTALSLQHAKIPASLHFEKPNPRVDFDSSPFLVNISLCDWEVTDSPRRAGVSSFGIGGTNAHVVIEEAPPRGRGITEGQHQLLVLSARSAGALDAATRNLAGFISSHADVDLSDVAYTLQTGRKRMEFRRAFICGDLADAIDLLNNPRQSRVFDGSFDKIERPVAFVFPGQGSQYAGMGREIYDGAEFFRSEVDRCIGLLDSDARAELRRVLFPEPGEYETAEAKIQHTGQAQQALFIISYSLARQLIKWGIRPDSMIGHSIGEFVAACLSGVMELEDALSLVTLRGKLMSGLPPGCMLALPLSEEETARAVRDVPGFSIAAVNGPKLSIISGSTASIDEIEESLSRQGISSKRLRVSHSFHSGMMEPILGEFAAAVARVPLGPPRIPYISNVTGTWITREQATSPEYYARHLRQTVLFHKGLVELVAEPDRVFVEVGPGGSVKAALGGGNSHSGGRLAIETLANRGTADENQNTLMAALARLWVCGVSIDWDSVHHGEQRNRVPLPTYPFERRRYWIDGHRDGSGTEGRAEDKQPDLSKWFYHQSWKRSPLARRSDTATQGTARCSLLFGDGPGLSDGIVKSLESASVDCVVVRAGATFEKSSESLYLINPMDGSDYLRLMKTIRESGKRPDLILHCWNKSMIAVNSPTELASTLPLGYCSLLYLVQAIGEMAGREPVEILVITNQVSDVIGTERLNPAAALAFGLCKVIPLEYTNIICRSVDIAAPEVPGPLTEDVGRELVAEAISGSSDRMVAYRNGHRWGTEITAIAIDLNALPKPVIRPDAAYLITGGMGEIEFEIASHLAELGATKLVITGLPPLPAGGAWVDRRPELLDASEGIVADRLDQLKQRGVELLADSTQAGDREGMIAALEQARRRFGRIAGVLHTALATGGGMIQLKDPETSKAVFAPKIAGTNAIIEALDAQSLDFLVLFSTTLSITGVFGQADYCGANSYIDAFASHGRACYGANIVSINWDITSWERWQEEAMTSAVELQSQIRELRERCGVTPQEAVRCMDIALALERPQVIVSARNFLKVLESQTRSAADEFFNQIASVGVSISGQGATAISQAYVAPAGEIEQAIALIWRDVFGIEQIGRDDDFFNVGGNSLVAIQVISRLRKELNVDLPMSGLFEHPTISSLAAAILALRYEAEEALELEAMLAEVEKLTPEQVKAALAEEAAENRQG